jgi:hypothetical protein
MFQKFKTTIQHLSDAQISSGIWPDELKISERGNLSVWYAPFDHVNASAKVILVGITPGRQQATNALVAARDALLRGKDDEEALRAAKLHASFSGPMRKNLVSMLDHIGLSRLLGISSCDSLWNANSDLAHFTSVLRYPVFKNHENYSGSPKISKTEFLKSAALRWTGEELSKVRNAWLVPLGGTVEDGLDVMIGAGLLDEGRVLKGVPHPSGANMERIKYFLGAKNRDALSSKVDAPSIDQAKVLLQSRLSFQTEEFPGSARAISPVIDRVLPGAVAVNFHQCFPYYQISRGKNAGKRLYPHVHEDGNLVVSPTRFEADYIRVSSLEEAIQLMLKRRFKLRMSNPDAGIRAPSLIRFDSLCFRERPPTGFF